MSALAQGQHSGAPSSSMSCALLAAEAVLELVPVPWAAIEGVCCHTEPAAQAAACQWTAVAAAWQLIQMAAGYGQFR